MQRCAASASRNANAINAAATRLRYCPPIDGSTAPPSTPEQASPTYVAVLLSASSSGATPGFRCTSRCCCGTISPQPHTPQIASATAALNACADVHGNAQKLTMATQSIALMILRLSNRSTRRPAASRPSRRP